MLWPSACVHTCCGDVELAQLPPRARSLCPPLPPPRAFSTHHHYHYHCHCHYTITPAATTCGTHCSAQLLHMPPALLLLLLRTQLPP